MDAATITLQKSTLIVGSMLLLGVAAVGGVLLGRTVFAPQGVSVTEPKSPPVNNQPVLEPEQAKPLVQDAPQDAPVPSAPKPAPLSRDRMLALERKLLEVARTALAKGDFAGTLEAVQKHEVDFPNGRLEEEREAIFIQALAASDRRGEAVTRAQRFRSRFRDSLLLPAVDAAISQ